MDETEQERRFSEKKRRWDIFLDELTQLGKKHNVFLEGNISISDLDPSEDDRREVRSNWEYVRIKHSTFIMLQDTSREKENR